MDEIYQCCFFHSGERICESEVLNDKSKALLLHEGYFFIRDIWQNLNSCEELMREKGCLTNFNKFKKVYQPEYKEVIKISKTDYKKITDIGVEGFEFYLNRSPQLSIADLLYLDYDEIALYLMTH